MRVALGKFACSQIRESMGPDVQAAARTALLHYVLKLKLGRPPVPVPRGLSPTEAPEVTFELTVDREAQKLLTREAERQGATLDELAVHSVLVYLAELDLLTGSEAPSH
jgi:hypothetical protein